jgi:hypothetical protein
MPITINLSGPDGNAFALMGTAKNLAKQLGWEPSRIDLLMDEMKSGDYDNLVAVFIREFDQLVILEAGGNFEYDDEDDEEYGDD